MEKVYWFDKRLTVVFSYKVNCLVHMQVFFYLLYGLIWKYARVSKNTEDKESSVKEPKLKSPLARKRARFLGTTVG